MASSIDRTEPEDGTLALASEVRNNFNAAADDIEALQPVAPTASQKAAMDAANSPSGLNAFATANDIPSSSGHEIQNDGSPVPQRAALNFSGDGVSVQDNVGNGSTDIIITNAQTTQVGGGVEIIRDITGTDPITINLRTFRSSDASVIITQEADTIDLVATGAGGGESNVQTNQGGGVELGLPKNGLDLPIRTLDTGQFELNGNQVRIPAGTFDAGGAAAAVQANLTSHENTSDIHVPLSSLPGDGLFQGATSVNVGSGDGITVNADDIQVDSSVARRSGNQTFNGNQTFTDSVNMITTFSTTSGDVFMAWRPASGTPDSRYFTTTIGNGAYLLEPTTDAGGVINSEALEILHGGGMRFGNVATPITNGVINAVGLQVAGSDVFHPGNPQSAVPLSRRVDTGTGLSGGGELSSDLTITVDSTVSLLNSAQTYTAAKTFTQSVVVGAPTGGAQGAGSINAEAVLINGTPVGTGGGDVSSSETSTVDGELVAFSGTSGKLIRKGGVSTLNINDIVSTGANTPDGEIMAGTGAGPKQIASTGVPISNVLRVDASRTMLAGSGIDGTEIVETGTTIQPKAQGLTSSQFWLWQPVSPSTAGTVDLTQWVTNAGSVAISCSANLASVAFSGGTVDVQGTHKADAVNLLMLYRGTAQFHAAWVHSE